MEAPEKGDTAESVARYFQRQDVKASAHYCIDVDSIVQCVDDVHIAWAAPGANHNGLQLEHAGYARQGAKEWADDYSQRMLRRSATLAAQKVKQYGLPVVFRRAADLRAGGERARGITTHYEVSQAFRKSDHSDPGIGFVIEQYLAWIRDELGQYKQPTNIGEAERMLNKPFVEMEYTPSGKGYWLIAADGGVFCYGDAQMMGSVPGLRDSNGKPLKLNAPITSVAFTPNKDGYCLLSEDGGTFNFGNASLFPDGNGNVNGVPYVS